MTMNIDVKMDSKLDKIASDLEPAMLKGLTTAAIRVHGDAVKNAEASVVTGRLRASIAYTVDGGSPTGNQTVADSQTGDSNISAPKNTAVVGTNVEYAAKVERTSRSPGYMRRAYYGNKTQVEQDIRDALQKAVKT